MPLIIICGTPVSGKTTRAYELKEFFEKKHGKTVQIVSEEEAIGKLQFDKNATYLDAQKEKRVRGYLKSEVLKLLSKDNVIILDGSNYIKGYRYELYCASKAVKSTQCTVYTIRNHDDAWKDNETRTRQELPINKPETDTNSPATDKINTETETSSPEIDKSCPETSKNSLKCDENRQEPSGNRPEDLANKVNEIQLKKKNITNIAIQESKPYTLEVFNALSKFRFEEPNSANRWDAPLFIVQPHDALDLDAVYKVLFEKKPPPPNMSTQNPPLSSTNFLYELDNITQDISSRILEAKKIGIQGEMKFKEYPDCNLNPGFLEFVNPQKLLKLRRQFLTYAKMQYGSENASKIGRYYIQYLNKTITD